MLFMLMACMMYRRTHYVRRCIIDPKSTNTQETYCALSLHIVYSIQMLLRMTIPLLIIISICFIVDTKYGEVLFPSKYSECQKGSTTKDGYFIKVYLYTVWLKDAVSHIVVFQQIFEWISIIHLLSWQKYKSTRELIVESQVSMSSERFSKDQISFRHSELKLFKVYKVTLGVVFCFIIVLDVLILETSTSSFLIYKSLFHFVEAVFLSMTFVKLSYLAFQQNILQFRRQRLQLFL